MLAILWAASLAAVLLPGFQGNRISSWLSLKYSVIVQTAQLRTDLLNQNESFQSAQLHEDGQLLGPSNAVHANIGTPGRGLFLFWKGDLILLSSNNSDPLNPFSLFSHRSMS